MFQQLLGESASPVIAFIGILAAFFLTCVSLAKGSAHLPKDQGREFAVGGALSAGHSLPENQEVPDLFSSLFLLLLPFYSHMLIQR